MLRLLSVIAICAGLFCLAQSNAQVPLTGAGPSGALTATPALFNINQATSFNTGLATITSTTVAAGNYVIVWVFDSLNGTVGTVTDSQSNCGPYSKAASEGIGGSGTPGFASIHFCKITTPLTALDHIIYTSTSGAGAGNGISVTAGYATNIAASSPQDASVTAVAGNYGTTATVTSGTPGTSGELFVGVLSTNNGGTTFTTPTGWTVTPLIAVTANADPYYLVNSGAGTETLGPSTIGTASNWAAIVVGLKHGP